MRLNAVAVSHTAIAKKASAAKKENPLRAVSKLTDCSWSRIEIEIRRNDDSKVPCNLFRRNIIHLRDEDLSATQSPANRRSR